MTKSKKALKGVISITRKGVQYWYARKGKTRVYCGKGEEGRKIAEAARAKHIAQQYEQKEIGAGLKVKRIEFKTFTNLSNWYMTLPGIQEQKIYNRKVSCAAHLIEYFGKKPINQIEGDEQEYYREFRKGQGAMDGTIDLEIELLSAMYHLAVKRKKSLLRLSRVSSYKRITEIRAGPLQRKNLKNFFNFLILIFKTFLSADTRPP
jgi:hypothetical protein